MASSALRQLGLSLVLLTLGTTLQAQGPDVPTTDLQGAWRQVDGEVLLRVKGDQLFTFADGALTIVGIVHRRPNTLVVRNEGQLEEWQASLLDGVLQLGRGHNDAKRYRRLPQVPAELELRAVAIPPPRPVPAERVQAIQKEVMDRDQREQEVRKDRTLSVEAQSSKERQMEVENRLFLTKLVHELGWPDSTRFGKKTSGLATILLKHTGDLPLELAVLPWVEKDLKNTGDGQTYSVLYDSAHLMLGKKQKYGSQICEDAQRNPYICAVEDPARVDDYRKAIGAPPLAEYRSDASRYLYDGKPVRLATPAESD